MEEERPYLQVHKFNKFHLEEEEEKNWYRRKFDASR